MGKEQSSGGLDTVSKGSSVEMICVAHQEDKRCGDSVYVVIDKITGEMFTKAVTEKIVQVGYWISDSEFVFYLVEEIHF